ncbi:hypothetical protein PRIC1_000675 [Phytophthora ramorum]|uniref:uncharacterized protein n=1 Tax=Phytophthora ramorum TaxID=164328 RepID=UPI0030A8F8F1|nr:hypothetical protein KRP23_7344 [Phytophthora ramorum]
MTAVDVMALVLELVAFFGFLCILLNILLPLLAFILRFALVGVPNEWRKWQLHRSQQRELRRLQRRVDVLARRKLADEQDTRRRARTASAQKRQQAEAAPQHIHPIADLVPKRANDERKSSSTHKSTTTPQQHRHRLSVYSTAKKPAASSMRRRRETRNHEEEL